MIMGSTIITEPPRAQLSFLRGGGRKSVLKMCQNCLKGTESKPHNTKIYQKEDLKTLL